MFAQVVAYERWLDMEVSLHKVHKIHGLESTKMHMLFLCNVICVPP